MEYQPKSNGRFLKLRLILSAIVLLMLALGFNALLSLNSLEKLYVASVASQYNAIGKDLQRNIEKSLKFGKSLDKFLGMDNVLEDTKQHILRSMNAESGGEHFFTSVTSDISVSIAQPDGNILYSTNQELVNTALPEQARPNYTDDNIVPAENYFKYQATYIIPIPIRDTKKAWIGTAIVTFDEAQIRALLTAVRDQSIRLILAISGGSALLLIVALNLMPFRNPTTGQLEKLRLSIVMFLFVGGSQMLFTALNTNAFKNYYVNINKEKTRVLTTLLKEDIEFFFSKGIDIEKLVKMDVILSEIIAASPELQDIIISNAQNIPLYMATTEGGVDLQKASATQQRKAFELLQKSDPQYNVLMELMKGVETQGFVSVNTSKEGYISTNISPQIVRAKIWEIVLDSGTILFISLVFFGELLILIFHYIEQGFEESSSKQSYYAIIRPAAFIFYFGLNVCMSFVPLYMEKLYEPLWGLSKEMIIGLPISIEMLFAGIAVFTAGIWIDRRGWTGAFFTGIILTAASFVYAWLAPDALHFIISRGITGIGYGFTMIAAQGFVILFTTQHTKVQGLTRLEAGSYAGYICGSASGAMLAQQIGYQPVFLFGAIIMVFTLLYAILFMRHDQPAHVSHLAEPKKSVSTKHLFQFLFHRNIVSLSFFIILPTAMMTVGFLYYLLPVYLHGLGTSQSDIGRLFMLHGLFFIYIAPFLSQYIDRSKSKKTYILISGTLGGIALVVFYLLSGYMAALLAVFLLGLAGTLSATNAYALQQNISQVIGGGKTMSVLGTVDRIGQVLGPIVFGWVIVSADISNSIAIVGGGLILLTFLFLGIASSTTSRSTTIITESE